MPLCLSACQCLCALALAGVHACERLGNRPTFCALAERATPAERASNKLSRRHMFWDGRTATQQVRE